MECTRDVQGCDLGDAGQDHFSSPLRDMVIYPGTSKGHHHHHHHTYTTNTTSLPQTKHRDGTRHADHNLPHLYTSPSLSPTSLASQDMLTPSPPQQSPSPPPALSPKHPRKLASRTSFCHVCYYRRKHHLSRLPIYFPCRLRPQGYHVGYIEDAM